MNKVLTSILIFWSLLLPFFSGIAQNITMNQITGNVAASPLPNNGTDLAILGFSLTKAGGGAASVSVVSISLTQNPVGLFTNPRVYKSADTNFGPADIAAGVVGSATFGASSIDITGAPFTDFGGGSGPAGPENFFVVVDIDNSVNSSTSPVTPSLSTSNITVTSTLTANTITGTAYSFADVTIPGITFNPTGGSSGFPLANNITITFSEPVRKTDASVLVDADLASLVELKLTDNNGATVPFTATINPAKTIITIDPNSNLASSTIYYVEMNPVEDASGNTTSATNITFTSADITPPTITFNPVDAATGVVETSNITITFNEAVRQISDAAINGAAIASLVELRVGSALGTPVAFTGSINGSNTIITIDPSATLAGNTVYYVKINPVEDGSNNATTATSITFTTGDTLPPSAIFSPANNATNVSAVGNITITFNEAIRKTDGTAITTSDLESVILELKETDNSGTAVAFTATLSGGNTIITLNPSVTLKPNQVYYVEVNPIEDIVGNESTSVNITFTTENRPSISGFTPSGGTCIGDNVTVNGSRFSGTGNPASGNSQPTVTVNGVTLSPANIVSFTNSQVVFTVPVGATSGPITIKNNDSDLTSSNSSTLNVFPSIDTSLPVIPATNSPAQNTNVDVAVQNTQDNNYSYAMILTAAPVGFSSTPPKTVHTLSGNSGNITLNTAEGTDPDFTLIGDYTFRIDVSRTGCTTKTLTNTPFTLTVASLTVTASATSTTVCNGDKIILIGSVSGGTGFYQFKWTSVPAGFNSTSSSPEVTPTANIKYVLEVKDNANNIITDDVDIVVNPKPTVTFVPAPLESTVRTNYTLEDKDYQLYSSLTGGVFTGAGVTLKNDGNYYFNPLNAGVGSHSITLTYTDGATGCVDTDVKTFTVSNSVVDGLEQLYCKNRTTDTGLKLNVNAITSPTLQFTRIRFYYNGIYYDLPQSPAVVGTPPASGMPVGASYPLTITSVKTVTDIQTLLSTTIPDTYSLNIQSVINGWGYGGFYLDVFAKNNLGTEQLVTWQYFRVVDNQIAPSIVGLPLENICSDTSPVTLSSSNTGYVIEQFSINPAYSGSLTGTKSEIFNPGHSSLLNTGFNEELLTIQMNYKDLNNCPSSVTSNINWVSKPQGPIANDVEFCQVVDGVASTYTIKGAPNPSDLKSTPLWYDAAAPGTVLDDINWEFTAPGITGLIPLVKTYLVQQEYKGCKGLTTTVDLEIKPAPGSAFTPPPICQAKDFSLTGPIDTGLGQPYQQYEWNFGDLSATQVVMNDQNITYNYVNDGNYNIRLTVTNSRGCQNSEIRSITVGLNPKPNFTFKQVCEGDLTEFAGSADIGVEKYEWDFGDGVTISKGNSNDALPPPHSGTYISPKHKFADGSSNASGDYNVTITSFTNIGCSSSLTKVVTILDTLFRSTANPYIMASEGGGNGLWRLEDVNGNSTWEFAQPTTTMMKEFTSPAWVTNADGFYVANEKSYLNSPCLNISNIERPIISMDLIFDTDKNIEGAVLEYSKDNGITWVPLGAENSGLNWFNTTGFRIGNIGNSPVGWSGKSNEDLKDNPEDNILVQARRALDNLPNLSQAERSKVRFRIAFATTPDAKNEFEGIGFNNLSISTRDRISLIEMFTNVNASNYTTNNNVFKAISTVETAKIQYHVTFPGDDTNASANKVDPASRAAYYGIPMSDQYIPRTYVDGYSEGMLIEGNWAITEFNKQSLQNSQYKIKIDSMKADDNSYLKMKVTVEAKVNIPATRNHILHIAVVEKTVGANEFVLRKLVPDVNGHALPPMLQADTKIVIDSVQLEKSFVNVNNLAIVAFVQDLSSREVFQAAVELDPGYLPVLVTGIESLNAEQISIYPNPASKQFRVELPAMVTAEVSMNLVDQVGRKHDGGAIPAGSNTALVNVEHLSEGIYILEIGSSDSIIRKKVMVVMKN